MSRKNNVKHNRSKSRYDRRLRDRGETSASVRMRTISYRTAQELMGYVGKDGAWSAWCKKQVDDLPKMVRGRRG